MTLERMFERWKEQANYDDDDAEVEDRVKEFINEGLNQIALKRLNDDLSDYSELTSDTDEPDARIPAWMHPLAVDYALYMWFRDGNTVKQQRAMAYLSRFQEMLSKMPSYADEQAKAALPDGRWALKNQYNY